ncbi:MAG TPA: ComEC/Rec2 family competence protein [Candidatus Saccharimonadales bacterium]
MQHREVRRTFFWPAMGLAVLVGIALSYFYVIVNIIWLLPLLIICVIAGVWKRSVVTVGLAIIAAFLLGNWRAGQFMQSVQVYDHARGKPVLIEGSISEDPTYSKKRNKQFIISEAVLVEGNKRTTLPGVVFVSTPTSPDAQRHNRVQVAGKLGSAFGPYQASIFFAKITVVSKDQHMVDVLRQRFAAATASVLPEPHASLGLGFAIGMKSSLTEDMSESLKALSLTHVVVASGYNLTILVRAAKRLRERHSKLQTMLLSFSLIGIFLLITGASPSMVRAGLVSTLVLLAWYVGRNFRPHVLLLLVMAITALAYPPFLQDLGWWLSFSAFAGIMIVAPLLIERLYKTKRPSLLTQIAIETMVAEIMTLPIILLVFGNLSLLGIIANVLVGPLIPLAMLATAVAGLTEMLLPPLASLASLPAHVILSVIVSSIRLLSSIPWTSLQVFISPTALVLWYVGFAALTMMLQRRLSRERRRAILRQQIV